LKNLFILLFCFSANILSAQENHFLVELEPRSPEVEDLIQSYEGTPVVPIMASNLKGEQVGVLDQKGKIVILWFWSLNCQTCLEKIPTLNKLQNDFPNLKIISYTDGTKEEMQAFAANNQLDFEVIPNAGMIAEGPYSGELGYPKMFVVDQKQIIRWVFPSKDFLSPKFDLYNIVNTLYLQLNS